MESKENMRKVMSLEYVGEARRRLGISKDTEKQSCSSWRAAEIMWFQCLILYMMKGIR